MAEENRKKEKLGMVWLAGAGCGGAELLTLKAYDCIKSCQVIVYDSLVDENIVSIAPKDSEKIYVGKRYGRPSFPQAEINALLAQKAAEGKNVVRLKGGDPFVFGRGGEEAEYLIKKNIPFMVIPGISSSIAVPELAGIPVTHRDISRGFQVITARKSDGSPIDKETLKSFACFGGTLVVLMGLSLSGYIADSLMEFGIDKDMPAAVISNGGGEKQRVLRTTVKNLERDIKENKLESPAVIAVGKTTEYNLRCPMALEKEAAEALTNKFSGAEIDSFSFSWDNHNNPDKNGKENLGCKTEEVLITGSQSHTDKLEKLLEIYGISARKINLTQIKIDNHVDIYTKGIEKIKKGCYTIFTSPNGVDVFFKLIKKQGIDIRTLWGAKVAAVGGGTCARLRSFGIIPDIVPDKYTVEELAKAIVRDWEASDANHKYPKKAVAFRSEGGSAALAEVLSESGFEFTDVKTYSAVPDKNAAKAFEMNPKNVKYSIITFSSGSGVRSFFEEIEDPRNVLADNAKMICIGKETAKELENYRSIVGDNKIIIAKKFSCEGLAEAVADSLRSNP